MSRWRALSVFAIVAAGLVMGLAPALATGAPVDDQPPEKVAPPAGEDYPDSPGADRAQEAQPERPDSFARREPPEPMGPRRAALSEVDIEMALRHGRSEKGKDQGLVLRDTGRKWMNALNALADEPTEGSGFWLEIYTPVSWLSRLSSDAARQYRDISIRDLDAADLSAVLRVIVHPDMPDRVSRRGMRLSASVEHVVIRPKGDRGARALQPLSRRDFDETAVGRHGREATFSGVQATFDLDAVADVRRQSRDGEFDVIVIGSGDREKTYTVKKKHFERLPGLLF
jgi:hypothetical protein